MGTVTVEAEQAEPADRFDVGDRVTAMQALGGFFRPRVPRGTAGIVVARAPGGELEVHFATGRTELVDPARLAPAERH